jgi:hypothetical protein
MVVMESGVCLVSTISAKSDLIWLSGYGKRKLNYHKTLYKTYVEHCGKIYLV